VYLTKGWLSAVAIIDVHQAVRLAITAMIGAS